jgi:hypothetical protein
VTPSDQVTVVAGGGNTAVTNGTTISPATSAQIEPEAIAVDASGDLFLADNETERVEEVTPAGLTVIAGNGAQINSNQIAPVDTTVPATSSPLWAPAGLVVTPTGQIYVSLERDEQIAEFTPGSHLSIVAGLVSRAAAVATNGPATSTALNDPALLTPDAAGDIYFTDDQHSLIEEYDPSSGLLTRVAGTSTSANPTYGQPALSTSLNTPLSVAVGSDGTLYIADDNVPSIDALTPQIPVLQSAPSISPSSALSPGMVLTATGGAWSNNPTSRTYQWQDCDPSGQNCANIAGARATTYLLAATDVGHTVRVLVGAQNAGGSSAMTLTAATAVVTAATTTTTTTTTTPPAGTTGVGPTTMGPATSADAVTVASDALSAGLQASSSGVVSVPLECPQVVAGVCAASGTLSISANPDASGGADALVAHAAGQESVIARFAGIQIQSGQQKLVATNLSSQTIAYLRAHNIYRVRVTLHLTTTLTSGESIASTQHVWLYVPGLTGCHAATGSLTRRGVGSLRLGSTHRGAHRTGSYRRRPNGFEKYCVAGGIIRVAYSSRKVAHADHVRRGRVVIALTSNHHYAVHGVRSGTTVKAARARLRLGRPLQIGKNAWYFIPQKHDTLVVKAQKGVVREIGVASRSSARTRMQGLYLLRHLK